MPAMVELLGWPGDVPAIRLRKGFDILHLNWHYGYERVDMAHSPQYPWATFQWLVNQAAVPSVSLSADLLLPFDHKQRNSYFTKPAFINDIGFSRDLLYHVVLTIVEIHISAKEAA
jgi:hypothetical protein